MTQTITITIERAALIGMLAHRFNLSMWETTIVETICDKYWRKIDDNCMINKKNIQPESIICASVLYSLPERTEFEPIVREIMSSLHTDSSIVESRITMTKRLCEDYKNKVGDLKSLRLVEKSKAVELMNMLK
jgi:hypothetical protein